MKSLFKPGTLLCFSPPVMIATIIIELGLAVAVGIKYTFNPSRRLITLILICLGGFQLAEFNICTGADWPLVWSRVGYSLITFLPALGIHLAIRLAGRQSRLIWAGYLTALAFVAAFAFVPANLNASLCTGNYIIFSLAQPLNTIWSHYYLILVLIGLVIAGYGSNHGSKTGRRSSMWFALGYLAFLIPTYTIYYLLPAARLGTPSIMCGFAVALAIILGFKVAPRATK